MGYAEKLEWLSLKAFSLCHKVRQNHGPPSMHHAKLTPVKTKLCSLGKGIKLVHITRDHSSF